MRRWFHVPLVFVGITLVTFALLHFAPGDAAATRLGLSRGASAEAERSLRQLYGLDRPLVAQYADWLGRTVLLDFGASFIDGEPVRDKLLRALPVTAALALASLGLALLFALVVGTIVGGRRRGENVFLLVYSIPVASLAMWLLAAGAAWGEGAIGWAALALAVPLGARLTRHHAVAMRQALASEHVRTARAKGASPLRTLVYHGLRSAALPLLTLSGLELPALLSGSVIVEQLFGLPGLGQLAFEAVLRRDHSLIMGLTTLAALITLAAVVVTDVAYHVVDPRLRKEGA